MGLGDRHITSSQAKPSPFTSSQVKGACEASLAATHDKKLYSAKVAALAREHQGRVAKFVPELEVGRRGQICDEITHALDVSQACRIKQMLSVRFGGLHGWRDGVNEWQRAG